MKQVTVYTTKKNVVPSYGEYVPQYKLSPIDISYQAGECFDKRSVDEIERVRTVCKEAWRIK